MRCSVKILGCLDTCSDAFLCVQATLWTSCASAAKLALSFHLRHQCLTSAVSLRSATLAVCTPDCALRARSTADEQDAQCIPLTDTCRRAVCLCFCFMFKKANLGHTIAIERTQLPAHCRARSVNATNSNIPRLWWILLSHDAPQPLCLLVTAALSARQEPRYCPTSS